MRQFLHCLAVAAIIVFAAPVVHASPAFDEKVEADIKILQEAQIFCIGSFGFTGRRTEPEEALRRLLKSKDGIAAFQKVMEGKRLEGQVYALVGLGRYHLIGSKGTSPLLLKLSEPFLSSHALVSMGHGCFVQQEDISKVVEAIRAGKYHILLPPSEIEDQPTKQ